VTACGGAGKGDGSASQGSSSVTATTAVSSATPIGRGLGRDADGDKDKNNNNRYDSDDNFGHEASTTDKLAVTSLVKRYYAAAAEGDGTKACLLISSILAESVAEEYGRLPALRGDSCAAVMSKLLEWHRQELAADVARLRVTKVQVDGSQGWVLLSFGRRYERRMLVHRDSGAWKIDALLDIKVP
jgi:hypothetical protein